MRIAMDSHRTYLLLLGEIRFQHPADALEATAEHNGHRSFTQPPENNMNDAVMRSDSLVSELPQQIFRGTVVLWFSIAAIGHWIFLSYIVAVFFPPVAEHGLSALEGMHLPSGFVEGDTLGNVASVSHVILAAIIIGGGPLQLIPAIRTRFPTFHRWLGRIYLLAAVSSAAGGLYMTWTRSTIGDVINQLGISGDGVLIIVFAALAVRFAIARDIKTHRRWALRLFMVASAVWFFRVGLMGWVMVAGGAGINWESFTGPFLYVLGFAQYLLPLAMLEWYFRCQQEASNGQLMAFSATLFALTLYMIAGIITATAGMWLPKM
ncbi:MAG: DUF2306 domain-containing protein [Pseudomonadota bacterium]